MTDAGQPIDASIAQTVTGRSGRALFVVAVVGVLLLTSCVGLGFALRRANQRTTELRSEAASLTRDRDSLRDDLGAVTAERDRLQGELRTVPAECVAALRSANSAILDANRVIELKNDGISAVLADDLAAIQTVNGRLAVATASLDANLNAYLDHRKQCGVDDDG